MGSESGKFQARKVYGSSEGTCLAQISLGADQLAVAVAAHAGLWQRDTVMAMTKDVPQIHLPFGAAIVLVHSSSMKPTSHWGWALKHILAALPLGLPTVFQGINLWPNHTQNIRVLLIRHLLQT